ncbi:MAG TPA: ATP synthase subunit I [Puia sp.]|nr:ATP synthase subunit I [Puia sp.]
MILFLIVFLAAMVAGGMFYGGLWYTTSRLVTAKYAAVRVLSSFLIRSALLVTIFYALAGSDARRWLICAAGMLTARLIAVRWVKRGGSHATKP